MKKLSKIIVGAVLSVAMVVTGGIAALTMSNSYAATSSVKVVGGVTSFNGTVEYGAFLYTPTMVSDDATVNEYPRTHKGVKLTGVTSSSFNLGQIDISKSSWNGTETTITGAYIPFIEFVYHPTEEKLTQRQSELKQFTII